MSDEREMLGGEEGQLLDGRAEGEKDEGEDFEGHQLEALEPGQLGGVEGEIEISQVEEL